MTAPAGSSEVVGENNYQSISTASISAAQAASTAMRANLDVFRRNFPSRNRLGTRSSSTSPRTVHLMIAGSRFSAVRMPDSPASSRSHSSFFSSRRRHTRYWRDWSSDVCSSDLADEEDLPARVVGRDLGRELADLLLDLLLAEQDVVDVRAVAVVGTECPGGAGRVRHGKIGRASCRERV